MKFTNIPKDFTPLCEGLIFEFDTEEVAGEVKIKIVDSKTGEVLGCKHLYDMTVGKIDVAPYVEHCVEATPHIDQNSSIEEASLKHVVVYVNGEVSPEVVVSTNRRFVALPSLVTTMPHRRRIAYGSCDNIALHIEPEAMVNIYAEADTGESLNLSYQTLSGAATVMLSTLDFNPETRSIELQIWGNDVEVATISYEVVPQSATVTSLAWRSSAGSIEQYPFPVSRSVIQRIERIEATTAQGEFTSSCRSEKLVQMVSNYENRATIAALAEIVGAARVWFIDDSQAHGVKVATSSVSLDSAESPDRVELEVRLWRREEGF